MPINFNSALGIHADTLRIRAERAELLAQNLANANTPNYKARDIDFQAAMKLATSGQPDHINTTHQKHFPTAGSGERFSPALLYRQSIQDSLDGNTVDEQIEQSQFMQNSVQYQASLDFLGGKFRSLRSAIKGE